MCGTLCNTCKEIDASGAINNYPVSRAAFDLPRKIRKKKGQ